MSPPRQELCNGPLAEGLEGRDLPPYREGVELGLGRYEDFLVSVCPRYGRNWFLCVWCVCVLCVCVCVCVCVRERDCVCERERES